MSQNSAVEDFGAIAKRGREIAEEEAKAAGHKIGKGCAQCGFKGYVVDAQLIVRSCPDCTE
jgi:hypothetical protein